MKLTKDLIGKKLTKKIWKPENYIIWEYQMSKGIFVGLDQDGVFYRSDELFSDDWLPYEPQPKQEVLMSPSVLRPINGNYSFGYFQSDKPLRVVLKNLVYTNPDGTIELSSTKILEADLWIKLDGEQS
jgi:hypothetical protein